MPRNAFTMKLKPGFAEEYQKRHDAIWPELQQCLSEAGVSNYSIYLQEDSLTLFAFQEVTDDYDEEPLARHPIIKKWWDYMADIMDTHSDNSPVAQPLKEVFHMD